MPSLWAAAISAVRSPRPSRLSGLSTALLDRGPIPGGASRANYGNIQVQDAELDHSLPMVNAARRRFAGLEDRVRAIGRVSPGGQPVADRNGGAVGADGGAGHATARRRHCGGDGSCRAACRTGAVAGFPCPVGRVLSRRRGPGVAVRLHGGLSAAGATPRVGVVPQHRSRLPRCAGRPRPRCADEGR